MEKIIKFLIVGSISTIINYGTFAFIFKLIGVNYLIASVVGYISGLFFGYYLNKNWTFIRQAKKDKSYIIGYVIVYGVSLLLSQVLLLLLVELINLNPLFANIFVPKKSIL